ncbi:DUF455-containing protein [Coleophoma crateriformis]|uniref:DUF455-containing protein n=1 Tax=Coleophoma crateriformis TaxID=565419 RepID=A0A3D8SH76_9HELO|nr:DUF455-containing protein [Coleophoma crateriformis]
MGKYVPPDQEGVISGNKLAGKHALGSRAKKISQGILTVRFEMPYPIWCTSCPKPTIIGQGVRFNAEKKKIGNYYSTPIYSFRMKHVACGNWIEIQTDPKNTAYVVVEGARKRDLGEDKVNEGDVKILTTEEREALRNNAFATLEVKAEDKKRLEHSKLRLEELQDLSEQWEDPYERNKRLRRTFREGRKQREKEAGVTAALQDKMSLGLDILPENEDDVRRAGFIQFGDIDGEKAMVKAVSKPLFALMDKTPESTKSKSQPKSKKLTAEEAARKKTADAVAEIRGNTRAAMDPFLIGTKSITKPLLAGVKRKRNTTESTTLSKTEESAPASSEVGLVDYESD